MADTREVLIELREAERRLIRAVKLAGMARGKQGYLAPTITAALDDVRHVIRNIDTPTGEKRRSWPRLARTQ